MLKLFTKSKINHRTNCYEIVVGKIILGGYHNVAIQSMTTTKTSNIKKTIEQINHLVKIGCDLVRVAVFDEQDANALKKICLQSKCPIIADIHFNYIFALKAIEAGCKKIRINPDNINNPEQLIKIINLAKKYNVAIRIGINGGSIHDSTIGNICEKQLVIKMLRWIHFFEVHKFKNLVLSIKHTNLEITKKANLLLAKKTKYPIHLGATEAGPKDLAIVKSCNLLLPLLNQGIGCTIRISINGNPQDEIYIARAILNQAGLYHYFPNIIACPLCGRNLYNTTKIVSEINSYLKDLQCNITIAIMGCVVNGLGEANYADLAVCIMSTTKANIYKKGKMVETVNNGDIIKTLKKYINQLIRR